MTVPTVMVVAVTPGWATVGAEAVLPGEEVAPEVEGVAVLEVEVDLDEEPHAAATKANTTIATMAKRRDRACPWRVVEVICSPLLPTPTVCRQMIHTSGIDG